jgi:DNA polymerase-3 subunit delta'
VSFDLVLGQDRAIAVLRSALVSGRLAPAYLFSGPPGVGKRFTAVQLVKALNCERGGADACDTCSACRMVDREAFPDLYLPTRGERKIGKGSGDGTEGSLSLGEILRRLHFAPVMGRWKVVLIDPAEALTAEAGNMLLKTLEEPPQKTMFLLTAVVQHSILPTIRSRCQALRFTPLPPEVVRRYLEGRSVQGQLAESISRACRGSIEVAEDMIREGVMDQKALILDYLLSLFESPLGARVDDTNRMLGSLAESERQAVDRVHAILAILVRDLLWAASDAGTEDLVFVARSRDLVRLASRLGVRRVLDVASAAAGVGHGLRHNENPRHILLHLGNRLAALGAALPAVARSTHARS